MIGKYAEAVKLCQKPGISDHPLTISLLSYAYACMKKHDEAMAIVRRLMAQNPVDETVISNVAHTMKLCRVEDELASLYESMLVRYPNNEALTLDLFHCYTRQTNSKKMQFVAQKLYKITNKSSYVYWIVSSLLQQDDLPDTMLIVGEKMLKKILLPNSTSSSSSSSSTKTIIPGAEELELFIEIFIRQRKYQEALIIFDELSTRSSPSNVLNDSTDFAENSHKVTITLLQRLMTRVKLLEKIPGNESNLKSQLLDILEKYPDQWDVHERLINIVASHGSESVEVEEYFVFLRQLQQSKSYLRGPFLAEITLKRDVSLLIEYIVRFMSKQCCFSDIKEHIFKLSRDQLATLQRFSLSKLEELQGEIVGQAEMYLNQVSASPPAPPSTDVKASKSKGKSNTAAVLPQETLKALGTSQDHPGNALRERFVNTTCSFCKSGQVFYAVTEFVAELSESSAVLCLSNLIQLFETCKKVCVGGVGGAREVQPNDELLLLLSSSYRRVYREALAELRDHNHEVLSVIAIEWLALLLYAMESSPWSYTFKLEALEPLRELGLAEPTIVAYNGMGAKYIQHDTLSYLLVPCLIENGFFREAAQQNRTIVSFHAAAKRETLDMMSNCFKSSSYMKSLELKKFVERCQRSTQLALARAELLLLDLVDISDLPSALDLFKALDTNVSQEDQLIDNMDYELLVRVDSTSAEETSHKLTRARDIRNRIQYSRIVSTLLRDLLVGTVDDAVSSLQRYQEFVAQPTNVESSRYHPWNQNLHHSLPSPFLDVLQAAILALFNAAIAMKQTDGADGTREMRFSQLRESLQLLSSHLSRDLHFTRAGQVVHSLRSPQWIKSLSLFARTFAPWATVILLQPSLVSLTDPVIQLLGLSFPRNFCRDD